MTDPLSPTERSERMSRVRGKGNRSTEGRVEQILLETGISGWVKHPTHILGKPDFFFPEEKLALFVDGCFWHGCPTCNRRTPATRAEFWKEKIAANKRRDNRVHRVLRQQGFHVMRVWEHDLRKLLWLRRLQNMLAKATQHQI